MDDDSVTNVTDAFIGTGSVVVTAGNVTVNAANSMTVVSVAGRWPCLATSRSGPRSTLNP